jgi:hypothetical protein
LSRHGKIISEVRRHVFSVFGVFDCAFRYTSEEVSLWFERSDGFYTYNRHSGGDKLQKIIGGVPGDIIINPVEPVNLPKEVTRYLEIHFSPVAIGPEGSQVVYLTFPIEIGVFLESKGDYDVLDIFTLTRPKYSLYGPAEEGVITRYAESQVYDRIPGTDPMKEGVMALSITNASRSWVEVSRVVIDTDTLSLYYGDMVSMVAVMKILSRDIADIHTGDRPLLEGMKQSVLVARIKKPLLHDNLPFMMEFGVND